MILALKGPCWIGLENIAKAGEQPAAANSVNLPPPPTNQTKKRVNLTVKILLSV